MLCISSDAVPTGQHGDRSLSPHTGVVPFVALLLLQRRPVAGRALLVSGSGCPSHGLCRSNVQEQTRRQVAVLNATAQELFSIYVSDARGWPGITAGFEPQGHEAGGLGVTQGTPRGRWRGGHRGRGVTLASPRS